MIISFVKRRGSFCWWLKRVYHIILWKYFRRIRRDKYGLMETSFEPLGFLRVTRTSFWIGIVIGELFIIILISGLIYFSYLMLTKPDLRILFTGLTAISFGANFLAYHTQRDLIQKITLRIRYECGKFIPGFVTINSQSKTHD